ncbi:MAG: hypothetical protein GF411_13190 [Candidatus Lokiarchaeota archaeon]|nr:hypothetical protein [Candidatus Lokiarchaeota archaeon]
MSDSEGRSLGSSLVIISTIVAVIILGFTVATITFGPSIFSTATLSGFSACLATILGLWSLYVISQDGLLREDPYHLMNLALSIALILFALVDIARTGAILNPTEDVFQYTVSSTLVAILVILVFGIVGYARSVNSVLNHMKQTERIFLIVISLASAFLGLSLVPISGLESISRIIRMMITTGGFTSLSITLAFAVLALKRGSIAKQLAHITIALILISCQSLLAWWTTDLIMMTITSVLGAQSYLLISLGINKACEECANLEAGTELK